MLTDEDHFPRHCWFVEAVGRRENQTEDQIWEFVHAARSLRESDWWRELPVNEYNSVRCSEIVSGEIEGR